MIEQQESRPGEGRCSFPEFLQILATHGESWQLAVPSNGLAYGCRDRAFYCQLADAPKLDQPPASEHRATHETALLTRQTRVNDVHLPTAPTRAKE